MSSVNPARLGVVGGLGALAGADALSKIVKAAALLEPAQQFDVLFEQAPFDDSDPDAMGSGRLTGRKLYVYQMIRELEVRDVDTVLLPCFISHTFLDELVPEIGARVVDMMAALGAHIASCYPDSRKLGIITSAIVRENGLFDTSPALEEYEILYPASSIQEPGLREAVYGTRGIKAGYTTGVALETIQRACGDLIAQGADIIVPGCTEIPLLQDALNLPSGVSIIDCNQVYAEFALRPHSNEGPRDYKIGIIGGVGPLATVDFMDKVIRHTDASTDQDHIKMVVEHNPQIPDRTGHLLTAGPDPTLALLAACQRLEADDADMIAIPCNTAHAFVERIQRYVSIPVIHMLYETACTIRDNYAGCTRIGLLASDGTVQSRVYHDILEAMGLQVLVPDADCQEKVMAVIYGESGVKAGFTTGTCVDDLRGAVTHLAERGAEVVILGCTEFPILLQATDDYPVGGGSIVILDPTEILARRCVTLAQHRVT